MRSASFAIVAAAVLIEAGCAPSTPESMREAPSKTRTFDVAADFEKVFAREQEGFLRCLTGNYYEFAFSIQPRIDHVARTATIPLTQFGGFPGPEVWALVDIRANGDGTTVTADTTNHPLMADFPEVAEDWANGGMRCPKFSVTTHQWPNSQ